MEQLLSMLNMSGKGSVKRLMYSVFVVVYVANSGIAALPKCIIIASFVVVVIAMQELKHALHPELPDEDDSKPEVKP